MQTKTQTASHPPQLPHDQPRPQPSHHHQACQQTYSHRTSPPRSSQPQPAPPHPTLLRSRPRQTRAPRPLADHSIARHPVARHSPVTLLATGWRTAKPTVKHQTPHTNPAPHPASPTNHQQPQRAHVMTAQGAQRPVTTPAPPQPGRQRFDPQAHRDSRQDSPSPRSPPRTPPPEDGVASHLTFRFSPATSPSFARSNAERSSLGRCQVTQLFRRESAHLPGFQATQLPWCHLG